jgi:outer membrane protein assembly factor BamB
MQNSLIPSNPGSSKFSLRLAGRETLWIALICLGALVSGCSGRDIHKNLTDTPDVLVQKWTFQTHPPFDAGDRGTEYSNPVIVDNTLIFGNQSVGVIALYPSLNQRRWVLPIPHGVMSELVVDHGTIFFGGGDGFLYSVDVENGRVNWKYELRNPIVSRPTVNGGRVFVTTSDDTVYAFDSGTGKWLWHYRRRTSSPASILGASQPLVDGNEVLAGLSDGFLVALSVSDGQLKWEKKLHNGTKFTDVDAHPVLENGVIYIPSYDGALYALRRTDGDVIWKFDAGGSKDVLLDDQVLYLPSSDGFIYCVQKTNGKLLWKFELDRGTPTHLVATDRYLIVGSSFQYLYAIDKSNGAGLYRYNVGYGSGFAGTPAYDSANQRLYILSGAGNLYDFAVRPPIRHRPHGQIDQYKFE